MGAERDELARLLHTVTEAEAKAVLDFVRGYRAKQQAASPVSVRDDAELEAILADVARRTGFETAIRTAVAAADLGEGVVDGEAFMTRLLAGLPA